MGFFRKGHKSDGEQSARTVGLVIEAPAPPEGGPGLGPGTHAHVRVQADLGTGRRVHEGRIRMSEAHWLVPGMEVEVTFDHGRPDQLRDRLGPRAEHGGARGRQRPRADRSRRGAPQGGTRAWV